MTSLIWITDVDTSNFITIHAFSEKNFPFVGLVSDVEISLIFNIGHFNRY